MWFWRIKPASYSRNHFVPFFPGDDSVILFKIIADAADNRLIYPERKIWEPLPSVAQRIETGKQQRFKSARESHAEWNPKTDRTDPVQILIDSAVGRVEKLIPIRYGRMLQSPFAFLRGSAAVMAKDLSDTQNSGVIVQCCGDCHLMNFGGYATPEETRFLISMILMKHCLRLLSGT